jgi:hypothetical protein
MVGFFGEKDILDLSNGVGDVHRRYNELQGMFLARTYKSARAREFAYHGFCRRLGTLVHCIDKVFTNLPPELDAIPSRDVVVDATIAIQASVLNAFGCLDNLAWIWVEEKPVTDKNGDPLDRVRVGLGKKSREVRDSFSSDFVAYLNKRQPWVDYLKGFRDALAHRIPLYVPPFIVDPKHIDEYNRLEEESGAALSRLDLERYEKLQAEQRRLGLYRPWMTHSAGEKARGVKFHAQMLADYLTIDEFGREMLSEIERQLD